MKTKLSLLLMAFLMIIGTANAQTQAKKPTQTKQQIFTDDYQKQEVVNSKYKKLHLMSNAKRWVAKNFDGFSNNIKYEDKDGGIIHINTRALVSVDKEYGGELTQFMGFDIILDCKDYKYRYTINNLHFQNATGRRTDNISYKEANIERLKNLILTESTDDANRTRKILMQQEAEIILQQEIIKEIIKSLKTAMLLNDNF